ncbi:MAG: CotH kinase family protein [Patescibacteria group bacterium]
MTKRAKRFALFGIGGAALVGAAVFAFSAVRDPLNAPGSALRSRLLRVPFVQNLLPTYHALRKLPDVLFFPYALFGTNLPVYKFTVLPVELLELNVNLPADPIGGQLTNEDRVYVKAFFQSGDYEGEVKLRYRGTSAHHWNSFQRSFRVKFPNETLFEGADNLNFIIPYDRGYFVEPLNFYRAKKLGALALPMRFGRVVWNGEDMGVYLVSPGWSDALVGGSRMSPTTVVYGADDARAATAVGARADDSAVTVTTPEGAIHLTRYTTAEAPGSLETLLILLYEADDDAFARLIPEIFDLEKFYAWNIMNILAGSPHYDDTFGNLFLLFDPASGRFELSPWDPGVRPVLSAGARYEDTNMRLARRILSVPKFLSRRNELLRAYLTDPGNLADDLAFFDRLYRETRRDFFSDSAKLYNNLQFLRQVKTFRAQAAENFRDAPLVLSFDKAHYARAADRGATRLEALPFTHSFARLAELALSVDAFVLRYPLFQKVSEREALLPAGAHTFSEDIIMPSGVSLTIEPGATLYLGDGVSLMVFGALRAEGEAVRPIRVLRAYPGRPWGVLGVVNAEAESKLRFVEVSGGSGETLLGRRFTGMVSFFNADVSVAHSRFSEARDDDALNVKESKIVLKDSLFERNAHDGVDIDLPKDGSEITANRFIDNGGGGGEGGDALDISWSTLRVSRNMIKGCTDKGISVGESSRPVIVDTTIEDCPVGIAVKDSSDALILNTVLRRVGVGVAAYQKHGFFGGARASLFGVSIEEAREPYASDASSRIEEL